MKLTPKVLLMSELILMLALLALLAPVLQQMHRQVVEDLQNRIKAIAATAALELDGDAHERIRESVDPDTREFIRMKSQLERIRQANALPSEHIYTFWPVDEQQVRFGVMTHDQPFVGDPYEMRPLMKNVLRDGTVEVTGIYTDDHGTWISAYAPIRNSQGEIVGILEVDEHATAYFNRLRRVTFYAIGFAVLVLLMTSLIGWYRINQVILQPLRLIDQGVKALGRQDFNHRVELQTDDEFQDLAETLNDVSRQLDLAQVIQRILQPESFEQVEGYELASISRPCDAAGGDYCDIIPLADGRLMVVMADVSGHGIAAALLMASCRSALRVLAVTEMSPAEIIERLEQHMLSDLNPGRFITMFLAILIPKDDGAKLVWSNAAHAPAMIVRKMNEKNETGRIALEHLNAHRAPIGVPLGDAPVQTETVLAREDMLLVASDGLIEAINEEESMFGMARVEEVLKRTSLETGKVVQALDENLRAYMGARPADDDLTIMCLKCHSDSEGGSRSSS